MVLDECPKLTRDKKLASAINTSTEWAKRSKIEFGNDSTKRSIWNSARRSL